jgi:hypothetical protein
MQRRQLTPPSGLFTLVYAMPNGSAFLDFHGEGRQGRLVILAEAGVSCDGRDMAQ